MAYKPTKLMQGLQPSPHWNYFLAIEDDADRIGRYVEPCSANFKTYSVEIARLLMAATQEVDVLLKQICTLKGGAARNEEEYRSYIPTKYPNIITAEVQVVRFGLSFIPYANWGNKMTPIWWAANTKVKHERHSHFFKASLENMLNAVCALLVANLYYHDAKGTIRDLFPGTKHLSPIDMIIGVNPTDFGMIPIYTAK